MAFNEEVRIKFMIDHYKTRFFQLEYYNRYDNYSTDDTAKIAKDN